MPALCEAPVHWSRGIGRRDELRDDVAGRTPRRFVEGRQILLHGAAGPRRIAIPAPILTCDRALLIGVEGLDQARIDGKAFAANQTGRDARLDDPFEHLAENISLAERLVAGARERRMIRDSVLDTELAEPAIGQVHLHFTGRSAAPSGSQIAYPTTSIRIISSGSIEGRPIDE